ncbi:hypothetical protein ABZX62_00300 [Streptomyces flavidovirens]|uniref:hypothetical protein n=1 Tax=Streptomyces flavidovirens TaxID=67298 RepID=UPI0033B9CDD8
MAERMSFILDGRDQLTNVLNGAGDSAHRLHRRISAATTNSSTAINRLATQARARLAALRAQFSSTSDGAGRLQAGMAGLPGSLSDVGDAAAGAGEQLGSAGGGLGGTMKGVAGIAGLSLLPALGALVPMMVGGAVAAGTLKLGFNGVGDAVAAASKGKKEYAAALKKLSPEARTFTKELVSLKAGFKGVGRDVQAAMLPGFTKAVKAADPVVKILGRSMTEMGRGFGDAAAGAGRLMKDSGFQRDFTTTLRLGGVFVRDLTSGLGGLGRGFLSFGAASGPTLKSLSGGIRDLLGKGLPGMFKGLEVGIGGSSKFLDGLFGTINRILPALGRFAGEAARTFGPLLGEILQVGGRGAAAALDVLGQVAKGLSPIFKDLAFGARSVSQIFDIIGPTIRDTAGVIVGALLPSFAEIDKARGPLQRLSDGIQNNKGAIQEMARVGATAFIDLVSAGVTHLPNLIRIFGTVTGGMVTAMGGVLHAAASAFGWIPGIGDKLKSADRSFGKFKDGYLSGLASAEQKTREFAAGALPKLAQGKLRLNISNWESQIKTAKAQLSDKNLPAGKRAKLTATITDLQGKVAQAKRSLASTPDKTARLKGNLSDLQSKLADAKGRLGRVPDSRKAKVRADIAALNAAVNAAKRALASLHDKTVTLRTHYVVSGSTARKQGSHGAQLKAAGGLIRGPGTGTSDDIPVWASNNEYMVKAASVSRYGVGLLDAINNGTFRMGSAHGGGSGGSSRAAGQATAQGLVVGMGMGTAGVESSARSMAGAVLTGIRAELQISSPSKRTRALAADAGKGMLIGLTGSKAKISATARDLVKDIWAAWKGTSSTKDSRLVAMVNRDTKRLQKLASQRDALAAKIAAAKKYAGELTASAREGASLGNLGLEPEEVTAGSIKGGLAAKLQKIRAFTGYINTLGKRGLSKTLLRQILNMGPEQGYAYASALAGASASTIKTINSTQSAIDKASTTLGRDGADRLYDAGKNAGKGLVKGLEGQQKDIEALMMRIAKGMQKSIKKALGIKSPSTVMAQLGRYSTEGLAAGLTGAVPTLDRALGVVTGRVQASRPVIGRPVVMPGGGRSNRDPVVLQATFNIQSMDTLAVGREIRKVLLELKRTHGLNVTLGVG